MTYDGENRVVSSGIGNQVVKYVYDGEGRRVQKEIVGGAMESFVYNVMGQMLEEYSTAPPQANGTSYVTVDHLGSTRVVTDQNGNVKARHDYLPFGEEVGSETGSRVLASGYSQPDGLRQKFTQKERDIETGLDYFFARYYSSLQGRFTSVDPENAGAEPGNPQSWNGYAYTINNPLLYSDPDGREYTICFSHGRNCDTVSDAEFNQIRRDGTALGAVFKDNAIFNDVNGTGELVLTATFERTGFDDFSAQANGVIFGNRNTAGLAQRVAPIPKAVAAFAGASVIFGTGAGAAAYAVTPFLAPTVTTLALRGTPLLPVAAGATEKLQKLGLSAQQASEIVASPASQSLVDSLRGGNINVVKEVGGRLVRITTNPEGTRIISAGLMRANQIRNGIANGRFVPK